MDQRTPTVHLPFRRRSCTVGLHLWHSAVLQGGQRNASYTGNELVKCPIGVDVVQCVPTDDWRVLERGRRDSTAVAVVSTSVVPRVLVTCRQAETHRQVPVVLSAVWALSLAAACHTNSSTCMWRRQCE
ncbi:hypothetical protein NP493_8253g00002 [Ridgeia piscesae]|uniref:Uncharacterized protein n=1 Tax=Ridgeia piscesae TaxID=27915 RepID=A0AAD9MMM8_RIDPI|nr:hypothetical protein NP493_8253g00002 [Ridgeia piscesae]